MNASLELMSETSATVFEDAAFNFVKTVSPIKNITKDGVPYEEIKDFISNYIQEKSNGHTSNGVHEEVAKEVNDDGSSRLSSSFQDDATNQSFPSFCSDLSPTKVQAQAQIFKLPKNERRMIQIRQMRRKAYETKESFPLECHESDLFSHFQAAYNRLVSTQGVTSIHCFHVIKNSLTQFFSYNTWSENVPNVVAEFLSRSFLKTTDQLCIKDSFQATSNPANVMLEYELMCLVEMYLLSFFPKPLSETNIVAKLRFLYFALSAEHMKKFVDETLCDEFAHVLPFYMTGIYEELCLDIPIDLEKYESSEHKMSAGYSLEALEKQSRKRNLDLEQMKEENKEDEEASSSKSDSVPKSDMVRRSSKASLNGVELKKKRTSKVMNFERPESHSSMKSPLKSKSSKETAKKPHAPLNIPETPEFKLNRKRRSNNLKSTEKEKEPDEVVLQTPLNKIRQSSRRISEKLTALIKAEENGKKKDTINGSPSKRLASLSQKSSLLPTASDGNHAKRKLHVDLRERFTNMSSQASVKSVSTKSTTRSLLFESPSKKSDITITSMKTVRSITVQDSLSKTKTVLDSPSKKSEVSSNGTLTSSARKKAVMSLDEDILQNYKKRMNQIRQTAKKADENEIFYGRSNPRSNLFAEDRQESNGVPASSSGQKNRSGRSVKMKADTVYVAHTLLNVQNPSPLLPFKFTPREDKKYPFRVRKLLHFHTFSKLKRLRNLTRKAQLNSIQQQLAQVASSA